LRGRGLLGDRARWAELLAMGAIASVVTLVNYTLFRDADSTFWTILAFASIVSLLPYLALFPALAVLRRRRAAVPRPFRVPGGNAGVAVVVASGEVTVLGTILLLMINIPAGVPPGAYVAVAWGGTLVVAAAGIGLWQLVSRASRTGVSLPPVGFHHGRMRPQHWSTSRAAAAKAPPPAERRIA
jgi:amino acid transporter